MTTPSTKKKFLEIDKVENNDTTYFGSFCAGEWGTFRVFFNFHENEKFNSLDIGHSIKILWPAAYIVSSGFCVKPKIIVFLTALCSDEWGVVSILAQTKGAKC